MHNNCVQIDNNIVVISASKSNPQGNKNLEIWEVKSGNLVASFAQKKEDTW